jgi:non-heme chloroperoxidase
MIPHIETRDRTSLFYKDWGKGQPVVFIHGWALGADMWEYQMPYLTSRGLRCIPYDKRGCGRSSQPWHSYDFDTFADDLAAVIEHLDLREVTLVGHSMGCGDITRYLLRHGAGRVARTALVAPTTPFILKTPDNPEGLDKSMFDSIVAELGRDRPRFLAAGAPAFFGVGLPNVSVSKEMIQWAVGLFLPASPKAMTDMIRTMSETDLRADMHAFTVPTLIIHGDADQGAPLDLTGRKIAEAIPSSQLKVYEGAARGLFITEKDRLNADPSCIYTGRV